MAGGLERFWWTSVPDAAARRSDAAATVLRDGRYLLTVPAVAAAAPAAAIAVGAVIGWRHPLITDLLITSVLFMAVPLVVSTLSAALGAWLMLGYSVADLVLAARGAAYTGSFQNSAKTWVSLVLVDAVLVVLVILLPITARALAAEMDQRVWHGAGGRRVVALAAVAAALMVFSWTQAALLLTRPYFTWHGQAPPRAELDALHMASWVLPLLAAAAIVGRAELEARLRPVAPHAHHPPRRASRPVPLPVAVGLRVALSVFLLAGLMDGWVDVVLVAVLMAALILLREPALRRIGWRVSELARVPVLLRLLAGAVLCAVASVIIVSILGTDSVVRPVVISTVLSLLIFTLLLPEHILLDEHAITEHGEVAAVGPMAGAASTAPAQP